MDVCKITIEKLDEKNYVVWAALMEALLVARGLSQYIVGIVPLPTVTDAGFPVTSKEKNECRALLMCSISQLYVPMVLGTNERYNMWKKLKDFFK